jgi:ATP-binding cassette subfamily F protein 3
MLNWLEDWLVRFRGAALVVSHDRAFLDRMATGMLEIDGSTHALRAFPGNYSAYLEQKIGELERRRQEYNDQQVEIAHLRRAAAQVRQSARFRKGGKGDSGDKFAKGFFANRTKGTIARAKHLERRLEMLLTDGKIEKPKKDWQMKLDFGGAAPSGRAVLALQGVCVGYDDAPLLAGLEMQVQAGARVVVIGPNGSGKTSLLRTIAGMLPPLAGEVRLGTSVRLGYMAQEQEDLDPQLNALSAILKLASFSETEARAFLHQFLFSGDEVFIPIRQLSYGERARLSLASLVARGCNLLLLDEPVNHLDIPARSRFEQALAAFPGTVIAVTHDRYFIEGFATQVWELLPAGDREPARCELKVWYL